MIKGFFTLLLSFFIVSLGIAQQESHIYSVKFTDKGNSGYSISKPLEFLSTKSVERRLLQQIPVTESDLPVNPDYLKSIRATGAEILYRSKWLNLIVVKTRDKGGIEKISKHPFVKEIIPADHLFSSQATHRKKPYFDNEIVDRHPVKQRNADHKNGRAFNYGQSLNQAQMIAVDQLHNMGFTGRGMSIAVIDAGFNSVNTLAAFDSLRANGQILGTKDFVTPGNDVYNTSISTHGMMVLSIMGGNLPGQLIGTAPKASYWLLRSEDGRPEFEYVIEEYYWVNAAEYADSVGADIINSSLGYTTFLDPAEDHTYEDMDGNTTVVTIGADMAASKGILVVNSAGNSGSNGWQYIGAPADGDSVFTIGAVDPDGIYASFSSTGPTFDGRIKPDVTAQGVSTIVAIIPTGVAGGSGTSFSSPVIAGASACLWQANPTFSNMELLNAIRMSGSQSATPDNLKGWGIPNFSLANNLLTSSLLQLQEPFSGLKAYPVPFSGKINIEVESSSWRIVDLKIFNSVGSSVAEMEGVELGKGKNMIVFNKLERIPKGIYMLQLSDGYYVTTAKVIK
ncbi:MAG: S8 family serine peptidase [Bacteroidota bacterium]